MAPEIALAGGTGFTGRRVATRLAARHGAEQLACLVRPGTSLSALPANHVTIRGDLADAASLRRWLDGCRTLVYVASMGFGHVPHVVSAAHAAGIERALFVSTTALFTSLPAPSKAVRQAAEDSVTQSRLHWTIVRPTMIYGAPGDRNMERLLRAVARWPLFPIPGSGRSLIQPVHVDDLADGIAAAVERPSTIGQAYQLSGAAPLPFAEAIAAAARAVGRRPRRIRLPLAPVRWALHAVESVGMRLPIREEQVLRLAEDKAFDHAAAAADFGFQPRSFEAGIRAEAGLLGLARSAP